MTVGVEPAQSPYQGIPAPDFHTISVLPSMDVSLSRLCSGPLPPLQPVATLPHDAT
ncbi:hypothetical protein GTX14_25385 [Streptomyces sp. SID4944]|nr:hypothetical protein [Streptomyces sp. SID4944]